MRPSWLGIGVAYTKDAAKSAVS